MTTGDTSATPVITKYAKEGIFYLDITSVSGVNPTLTLVLKVYDDLSSKWYTLASFSQKTTAGQDVGFVEYGLNSSVAAFYTIGGTNPSFTFSLTGHFKEIL